MEQHKDKIEDSPEIQTQAPDDADRKTTEHEEKLAACTAELAEWKERFVRVSADFENFKRRMTKDQALYKQVAQAQVFESIIAILDDFERAIEATPEELKENNWAQGIQMIYQSLQKMLDAYGIEEVQCKAFDPELHEALMQVESEEHESGAIVSVMQKGYRFNDTILRPAKVSVAK